MENKTKITTEPPHCINFVLCVVPAILRTEHGHKGFGLCVGVCANANVPDCAK